MTKRNNILVLCCIFFVTLIIVGIFLGRQFSPVTAVTDKYVFSDVNNGSFLGEGFFVTSENEVQYFIFGLPQEDPHKLENLRRSFFALAKTKQSFKYKANSKRNIYLATKYDLQAEHRILSPEDFTLLARTVKDRGLSSNNVNMIYQEDVELPSLEIKIRGKDILKIGEIVMTSGGSAFYRTIQLTEDDPVSIVVSTRRRNAKEILNKITKQLMDLKDAGKEIVFLDVTFQPVDYSTGEKFGWIVGFNKIYIDGTAIMPVETAEQIPQAEHIQQAPEQPLYRERYY